VKRDEIRETTLKTLGEVAPEIDPAQAPSGAMLREELGLDSMDYLELLTQLHEETGVEIPEGDYNRVRSIDEIVDYLVEHASDA
jgi:acyl carrier protein